MNSAESQFHGLSRKKITDLKRKGGKKEKNKVYYEIYRESLMQKTDSRSQTCGSIKQAQKRIKAKETRERKRVAEQERPTDESPVFPKRTSKKP